jgi:type IV pilus assembly protein PilX
MRSLAVTGRVRQSGVVLAITLLVLLILQAVGVSGMSASTRQFHLARNAHHANESFQNAESTLLIGERAWRRKLSNCLRDAAACPDDPMPTMIDDIHSVDWEAVTGEGATTYGKYVVEYLGRRPVPGERESVFYLYRLTARSQSADSQASTLLQSIYRLCSKTDGTPCHDQGASP